MKTTDRALREAMEVVLAYAATNRKAASTPQQALRNLVEFANRGEMPGVLLERPTATPRPVEASTIDAVRRRLCADLQALVNGSLSAGARKRIYAAADRMLWISRTGADGAVRYQSIPATFHAVVANSMALLLASPRDQRDLKQCQWRDCNRTGDPELPHVRKFFFVSQRREEAAAAGKDRTGRQPDRYCCEQHMRDAHRLRATAATIARRKKQREQKDQKLQAAAGAAAKHK